MQFQLLHEQWASYSAFYKYQPIGLVRYVLAEISLNTQTYIEVAYFSYP